MNRKTITKLLAAILAFMLTFANVILLGVYTQETLAASTELETQGTNVSNASLEFDAYFMQEGAKKHTKDIELNTNRDTLYLSIRVVEGYIKNGTVKIENANFNIIKDEEQTLEFVQSVNPETNTIVLNQIDKGESVILEIPIQMNTDSNFDAQNLGKVSNITLEGIHVNTKAKEKAFSKTIEVNARMTAKNITANLETNVVKYVPYSINEEKGIVLQTSIKSNIVNNILPIKQTEVQIEIPKINGVGPTTVSLSAISTKATNGGDKKIFVQNQDYTYENGIVTLLIKNEQDVNGKIAWQKQSQDEILLTLVYEEAEAQIANINLKANSKITVYNNNESITANKNETMTLTSKVGEIVSFDMEVSTNKLEKGGLLVAGTENATYAEKWTANIGNKNIVDKILFENKVNYADGNGNNYPSQTIYTYTKISSENFLSMLGQEGYIKIYDKAGREIAALTKDNLEYKYEEEISYIMIETSKPQTEGIIEIENGRGIKPLEYDKAQIEMVNNVNTKVIGTVLNNGQRILTLENEKSIALSKPKTVLEGTISKTNLATQERNEQVELRLVLDTNDVSKSLYKNPKIKIEFPSYITNISEAKIGLLYDEELKIAETSMKRNENGNIVIEVPIIGEQTAFNKIATAKGATIVIYANIDVEELAPNFTENIKVSVSNESDTTYDIEENGLGIFNIPVTYAADNGIITRNTISGYNGENDEVKAIKSVKTAEVEGKAGEKTGKVKLDIVNSTGKNIKDVKILGRTPFEGNKTVITNTYLNSTFTAKMVAKISATYGISSENITVYYSNNKEATQDIENKANGWTTDPTDISAVRSYMIVLNNYPMAYGARISFAYDILIPANIGGNSATFSTFAVFYTEMEDIMTLSAEETNTVKTEIKSSEAASVGLTTKEAAPIAEELEEDEKHTAAKEQKEPVTYTKFDKKDLSIGITRSTTARGEITDDNKVRTGEFVDYTVTFRNNSSKDTMVFDVVVSKENGTFYGLYVCGQNIYDEDLHAYGELEDDTIKETITIRPGESYEYRYSIIAGTGNTLKSIVSIEQDGKKVGIEETLTNAVEIGKIKLETTTNRTEETIVYANSDTQLKTVVTNISGETLKNIKVKMNLPQELEYKKDTEYEAESNYDNLEVNGQTLTFTINELAAGKKANIYIVVKTKALPTNVEYVNIKLYSTATVEGTEYMSNTYNKDIHQTKTSVEAKLTGSSTLTMVNHKDEIIYTINIKNNGKVDERNLTVEDNLPLGLSIQEYTIIHSDGSKETIKTSEQNLRIPDLELKAEETMTIQIKVKVDESVAKRYELSNYATISGLTFDKFNTNTVTYEIDFVYAADTPVNPDPTPVDPEPDNPEPVDPTPIDPEPDDPTPEDNKYTISGLVWEDKDKNGLREKEEKTLSDIEVVLINSEKSKVVTNTKTDQNGKYAFTDLETGKYIVAFRYNTTLYKTTTYQKTGANASLNSDAIDGNIKLDGKDTKVALTDTIILDSNKGNIDLGLIMAHNFDFSIEKVVNTVIAQNKQGTKTYKFEDNKLAKVELPAKQMVGTTLTIEYKITVKNEGDVSGTVSRIADYLPNGLEFSSEINPEWYQGTDGNLYTTELANTVIKPGENKEITLVLTKAIKEDAADIVYNTAEIVQCSNSLGLEDTDSTPGNKAEKEDDLGGANLIITIKTGALTYTLIILGIAAVIAVFAGRSIYNKKKSFNNENIEGKEVKKNMETKRKIKRILTLIIAFITIVLAQTNVKAAVDYGDYAHAGGESIAQSVEALKAGLGQRTTWTNHTVPGNTNDYVYGVKKYTTLQCADYSSTNYSQIPKLYGVIDINRTFNQKNNNMYTTAELWTPGSSYTHKSTEMAYLSYIAWASGAGKYSSNPTTWNSHWYAEYKKMDAICAGRVHSWTSEWRTGGSLIKNAANDANYYANFVKDIGEDGKVISNDNNKEGQRVSAGEAQITFDKFIIDENYDKTTGQGLGQAIGVYVTAQNGATAGFYVNKEGIHNKTGSGLSINGKNIENITLADLKSLNWTVSWNDPSINESNPMVQIKVDTSFYSYHGVIAMMYPETQGQAQGRVLTGGEFARLQQEVTFTLDGGTKIIVEKKWSGYKQDPNFVMPNSIDFIIYANVSGVEIEYARGTVYNNGSDAWDPYVLEIESLEYNGVPITGFRVEEVDLGLGEGWTTIVTETSPNHWVIVNNYKKQAKVPLLELNKVNEIGRELKDAKLKVTIDDYYTNSFATTTKDPDITISFSEVISSDPKMVADFEAQNAVELFNYSRNKRPQGPVGELPDIIYRDLKDELYGLLMSKLAEDAKYQEDILHVSLLTTHLHGYDSNGDPIYDDYCGFNGHCENDCTCCADAAARIAKAEQAVYEYVYGEDGNSGISKDGICRDLYDQHDWKCKTGVAEYTTTNPLMVDISHSVWEMYNKYPTEIHLNDLAAIYTTKHDNSYDLSNFDKEMHIKLEEEVAPRNYLKWAHDNDKHLYLTWQLGQVTAYHYDSNDNDSRELEYVKKSSTQTKSAGAITKSCANGIDWTLVSIRAWDAKVEDIIQFTKYAELANGSSSTTKPMDGVKFTIKIETQERLDGKGIAQGGLKSESWTVTKTTDKNGYIGITTKELQDNLKIDVISRWIGTMKVTYTEVDLGKYTPYYEKWFTPRSVTYEFTGSEHQVSNATVKGEVEERGEDAIVNSTNGYHVLTSGYDTPSWAPQMIIKKTDMAGNALAGAEFDVTIRSDRGGSVSLGKCITNKAGEFMIYPRDLKGLGITTMNRWTGDLTLIARETKAPGDYTNLNENRDIVANVHFEHGKIVRNGTTINQGNYVDWSIHNTWYEDEQHWEGASPTFVLSVKNSLDNDLRIRKVEANTEKQDYLDDRYLTEAEFDVTIRNGNDRHTRQAKLDSKGYFLLKRVKDDVGYDERYDKDQYRMSVTELADRVVGNNYAKDLGQFTGTLEVSIRETKTPSGYVQITDTMTVYLEYERGYYQGAKYKDNVSGVLLDVGKSEDRTTVTITVKNTKQNLQPIYIQKIDPTTNTSVPGVAFDITISKTAIREQNSIKTKTYTTGNEGMIAIETSELNKIGIDNNYSGDLYVLIEEVDKQDGYTMLDGPVYVHITYKNGNIENATKLSGDGNTTWINKNGIGMLKITVNNPWEIPDIEIEKRTLTNGEIYLIDDATFYVELSANGNRRYSIESKVSEAGKITFDSATLKKELGVDGTYTGDIDVYISEIDVRDDAAIVDEAFTITLTYKNGRLISSDIENKTHASVITSNDGSKVTITVNDSIIIPEHIFLGGYVWEEKATTKAGLEIDGIYTEMSDSEHTDLMITGIEATLYKKESDGTLKFVDNVAGTNPTLTDENGYYEFEVPKGPQYVVKFTYNGQAFEDAAVDINSQIYSYDWSSKGTEISNGAESRHYINDLYNEIGSYPANYKVGNFVFNGTEAREHFALDTNGDIYNISYRNTEIGEVRDRVAIETNNYLGEHKYINKDNDRVEVNKAYAEIYRNVIKNYYTENGQLKDPEIYNKLQFIHDSRISAVAGNKTEDYELTTFANLATYSDTYKYINLGIVKRDMVDLTLIKDAYSATVSINRKDTIYDYNNDIDKYTLLNYEEDYNYTKTANSNGTAYYNNDQIELYSTYKVTVTNEKDINTQLTEIVDYFDSNFGYKDEYTTSSGAKIKGIRAYKLNDKGERTQELTDDLDTSRNGTKGTSKTGRYIDASRIGLIGNPYLTNNKTENPDYSELFVTFAKGKEPSLKMGESVEFYITIKLGKGGEDGDNENYLIAPKKDKIASDILKEAINDSKNLQKVMDIYNYAEINGYMTTDEQGNSKGYFDDDSKPGTFIVKDFTDIMEAYRQAFIDWQNGKVDREYFAELLDQVNKMRGDDTWAVELDIMNNLNDSKNAYYHRSINGNVWEAVTNEVKTSTDLYNDKLLTYIKEKGIQGIVVELVELEPNGRQIVRAKTVTDKDGKYEFTGFIPGDYTVRFVYGAEKRDGYTDAQNTTMNNTSRNGYNDIAKNRGINGQYYQSTKANPNTDAAEYWYDKDTNTRYSDAYDEVTARIEQIEAQTNNDKARNADNKSIANVDNSWSWDYEWDGVFNAQTRRHIDQMEAYTSTMQFEVENTKVQLEGIMDAPVDASFRAYRYQINNIDFGLTPRAEADLNIDKYVSNIKVYLADNTNNANGTLQLDVDFLANGSVQKYNNNALFNNIVIPTPGENNTAYRDGLLEVLYDTQLLNGATIEVTYTVTVSNDGQANTITYFYDGNEIAANGGKITDSLSPIAHSYYNGHGEELSKLTVFEKDRGTAKVKLDVDNEKTFEGIKYHPTTVFNGDYSTDTSKTNTYKKTNYTKINNGTEIATTNTIMKHNVKDNNARKTNNDTNTYMIKEAAADRAVFVDVKTRATNIIDYVDPNLNFTQTKVSGEQTNLDWELTDVSKFNSTREVYDGKHEGKQDVMTKYNNIIRAVGGDTYTRYLSYLAAVANREENNVMNGTNYSKLYTPLTTRYDVDGNERENSITATLTLSKVLQTSSTETNDYEYSNLIELTRLENYAGKIIDLENYDVEGENRPETSEKQDPSDTPELTDPEPPTIGTSKSETIVVHEPTGLSMQDAPKANLGIVLIVLVIFTGGIILIKKFVLTPKNN